MPLGPPEDPDRFETFEDCVDTLSEDMSEEEARQTCGAWEAEKSENGIVPVTDLEQQDIDDIDVYHFWGIIQTDGEVNPVNIDHTIYYTEQSVEDAPSTVGTELHVDHISNVGGDVDVAKIGEVIEEEQLFETRFGLFELSRELWEDFTEAVLDQVEDEEESGNIVPPFNQIVEDIDAGDLAISAGVKVAIAETDLHDFTVVEIRGWNEVSIVGKPASPGSHAWPCDDVCGLVFGEQQMSNATTLNVDLETLKQAAEEDHEVASQLAEIVESEEDTLFQYDADSEEILVVEDAHQGDCGCESSEEELKQELQEVKEERDELQTLVDKIEADQREAAAERLRNVNESLPEEKQRSEDELDELIQDASVKYLNQTADMLEDVASVSSSTSVQEGKEDLSGSGSSSPSDEEVEQAAKKVDEVAQSMFGKSYSQINEEIESGEWGR